MPEHPLRIDMPLRPYFTGSTRGSPPLPAMGSSALSRSRMTAWCAGTAPHRRHGVGPDGEQGRDGRAA